MMYAGLIALPRSGVSHVLTLYPPVLSRHITLIGNAQHDDTLSSGSAEAREHVLE
jgi:hypothetical protein